MLKVAWRRATADRQNDRAEAGTEPATTDRSRRQAVRRGSESH